MEGSEDRGAVVMEGGSKGSERGNVGGWGNGEIWWRVRGRGEG
jgi:hypothetical protein